MSSNQIQTRGRNAGISRYNSVDVVTAESTSVQIGIGNIRATGKITKVNKNYPSQYNFAANQWNHFNMGTQGSKRTMHGGRFLLYFKVAVFIALVSIIFAGLSIRWKYFVPIPIVFSLVYMILTCYNLHIGRTNGSLFSDQMFQVNGSDLKTINEFFTIPLYGQIQSQFLCGIVQNNSALFANLRSQYSHSTEIKIMAYTPTYYGYTRYIAKSLGYFFLFFTILVFAIIMVASTVTVY